MFWNKKIREADREILSRTDGETAPHSSAIDVKISAKEQLYSAYSYSGDTLNPEFSEYVFDRAKDIPLKEPVTITIHTAEELDGADAEQTIKRHFRAAYREAKKEMKRFGAISAIMTLFGIIALTALILINHFTDNLYITSIVEIAAWVFIWEAVDYFFLQRPVAKAKCVILQRLCLCKTEIDKAEQ